MSIIFPLTSECFKVCQGRERDFVHVYTKHANSAYKQLMYTYIPITYRDDREFKRLLFEFFLNKDICFFDIIKDYVYENYNFLFYWFKDFDVSCKLFRKLIFDIPTNQFMSGWEHAGWNVFEDIFYDEYNFRV